MAITRTYVCFTSSFRGDGAPCISHETVDGTKTLCGWLVADAATVEPDTNDLDPDCNACRRIVRAIKASIETLTDRERLLYEQLKSNGAMFLNGQDVRVARRLSRAGLVQLDDNGFMKSHPGSRRSDGERWFAKIIAK